MPVKDVEEWGVFRTKLDVCGYGKRLVGGTKIYTFFANVANE